jgi:branched-chain amino acid aminotransferase
MAEKSRVVYFNGEFIPEKEASISIYDSALMFGDMVFEMTRSFNKKQFKLREHLERLYAGTKYLRIPMEMTIEEMEQHCYEVIEANDPLFEENDEHRLMIDVTRGVLSLYAGVVGGHVGTNVIIADFPLRWTVEHNAHQYNEGLEAVVPSQRIIPAHLLDPKIKNRSRIHYLMANIEVSNYQGKNVWALLLDPDGFVAEGTGANFFIVKDETLYTPEPRNILRGISRAYVMEMAETLGISCYEKNMGIYEVIDADEAFFTSTPFCMLPVIKINGSEIGSGKVGPMFKKLISQWSENVGVDIIAQIKIYAQECKGTRKSSAPSPYSFRN